MQSILETNEALAAEAAEAPSAEATVRESLEAKAKAARERDLKGYKPPRRSLFKNPLRRWGWLFLGPVVAAFIIGFVWPFIQGIYLSFCSFRTTSDAQLLPAKGENLFGNYIKAVTDPSFLHSFWYTALFAIVSLIMINVLAFTVAYALTQGVKGSNLFRTVFFMPNLIGGIVLGYIWSMIFDGILSYYGTSILMETKFGFWGLIILMCWQQIGYMMIIYIAGLQAVPEDMMEAAKIDGATKTQTLFRVVIPNVMPSITICTFLSLTNGFKLFDQNLALTGGLPFIIQSDGSTIKTTEMLALNIYNTFYGSNVAAQGTAQAKAVLFFILVAALGLIQLAYTRKREVQQ
ncbi:MAG: sugar ABC transporter permease [Ruminococcus sp.]|nr:sugar ABC transporter permease [Ruminococcus sp.]